jgi:hypothetical protein
MHGTHNVKLKVCP